MKWSKIKSQLPNLVKYGFSIGIAIYASIVRGSEKQAAVLLVELAGVFLITNLIAKRNRILAYVMNAIALLIYNLEILIVCFSGQFLKLIMLENITSFESLSGNFVIYIIGIVLLLLCTLMPVRYVNISELLNYRLLTAILAMELSIILFWGSSFSPLFALKTLHTEYNRQSALQVDISNQPDKTEEFFNEGITSYTDIEPLNTQTPNIVVIFTEGLSKNILDDEREIMPNAKKYQNKAISFENYFNHTAATYRGISSQLYSGYQLNNLDKNTLVSIQDILSERGYNTCFINTEPKNLEFTKYLQDLRFDSIISSDELEGINDSVSDKRAFEILLEQMKKMEKQDNPFFISVYTFGTHNTFDSVDEKYPDGGVDNYLLNKFYNLDYQFGRFMDEFEESELIDNTIIVFTTDHCTYNSEDYRKTFPEVNRNIDFLDTIPVMVH